MNVRLDIQGDLCVGLRGNWSVGRLVDMELFGVELWDFLVDRASYAGRAAKECGLGLCRLAAGAWTSCVDITA